MHRFVLALCLTLLLAAPTHANPAAIEDHDAFWLWAGVQPQPALVKAQRLYLLQGQVEASQPARLVAQRPAVPRLATPEVWMVIRVETLDWTPAIYDQVLASLARWRAAGNAVVGIQIDFDAGTRHLENYAAFLSDLRRRLPADCRLGITGLLDWSANGDPKGLAALGGVVDEVVLQIYQGRHVIPGYEAYLARLDRLRIPFRIGVLQGGDWQPPADLAANPWFKGTVLFLVNGVNGKALGG
jgi:hypothetical protein